MRRDRRKTDISIKTKGTSLQKMDGGVRKKRAQALCLVAIVLVGWNLIQMISPQEEKVRIACVGDSITYGTRVENREENCYPVKLQGMLGTDSCQVGNFGVGGTTAQKSPETSYWNEERYQQSLSYGAAVVAVMLGTNDAKTGNWKGEEAFEKDYRALAESYLELEQKPEVILMTPPSVFLPEGGDEISFGIRESAVKEAAAAVRKVGEELELTVIDIQELTEGHGEWFHEDGIHPNAQGAEQIARQVCQAVEAITEKE